MVECPLAGTNQDWPVFHNQLIEAHQLTKVFHDKKRGKICAVDNVSFRCQPGKIFGLLGVNGAGKTTCLRLLATLLSPTSGTATVGGYDVLTHPDQVRAHIGFLSTSTALYARLTAREVVEYFGRLHGMDDQILSQRVENLFGLLNMGEFGDRRCDLLSTGMKQKVSIARTLVHDPPVMVFDEPTHGLDILTARVVLGFIRDCRERGKTVIFSSHVMSEMERISDTIAIIHHGKLMAEGTLAELRQLAGCHDLEDIFVKTVGEKA